MKRIVDILVSFFGIVLLTPIFLLVAFLIRKNLGSPVIFSQIRPGIDGKPFKMYKFRSIKNAIDTSGNPVPDAERLTTSGQKLRSTSLDELPELWNVLKGDMSLVGPRPLLMEYLPLYDKEQYRRHEMRPGITGWAQINGRNAISWEDKFKLDVWYVDNQSLKLDFKILLLTIKKVFIKEGISSSGEVTTSKFTGSHKHHD